MINSLYYVVILYSQRFHRLIQNYKHRDVFWDWETSRSQMALGLVSTADDHTFHFKSYYSHCIRSVIRGQRCHETKEFFSDNFPGLLSLMALRRCKMVLKYKLDVIVDPCKCFSSPRRQLPSLYRQMVDLNFLGAVSLSFFYGIDASFDTGI